MNYSSVFIVSRLQLERFRGGTETLTKDLFWDRFQKLLELASEDGSWDRVEIILSIKGEKDDGI